MSTLTCDIGLPVQWDVAITRSGAPLELPEGTLVEFAVKLTPSAEALIALSTAGEDPGIVITDRFAGLLRVRLTAELTATLTDLPAYYVELLVTRPGEDPDVPEGGRLTLTATRALQPTA